MRTAILTLLLAASVFAAGPADSVNPMIGTAGDGQTFPATGVPFGMTSWTPQTRDGETKCIAPYYEKDTRIQGFRASHFLSGSCTQDYGSVTIMPLTGALKVAPADRASAFQRASEKMTPYRYDVTLDDSAIRASLAATSRAGILEFRFPSPAEAWILVQVNSRAGEGQVHIDAARQEVSGYNPVHRLYAGAGKPAGFSGYFVARFERPFRAFGVWSGADKHDGIAEQGGARGAPGAYLSFAARAGDAILVKVGTSFTSIEEARRNLDAEILGWNLDQVAQLAQRAWDEALSRIEIRGASDSRRRIFYTALYHSLLLPRTFSDVSGTYPGFAGSGRTETARGFTYYTDFSLWDTFRALHPLLTIIDPKRTADMAQSLIAMGQQGGWLPIYPAWNSYTQEMIGDHASVMIADAYLKGIRGFDAAEAYRLMRQNAMETPQSHDLYVDGRGRRALDSYLKYGFIPLEDPVRDAFHRGEQVSRTLEYAYDDFVLSRMAHALGKTEDEKLFLARAANYRNIIDPATGFARGRHADGTWATPFDPAGKYPYITEGLPFQYTFFVPQDIQGLIQLAGGRAAFIDKLDQLFDGRHYDHGNEPSHHIAYLYDYAGVPWKTQQRVRRVMDEQYLDQPAGIAGNDDCGQMSAWYVISALGFYSVAPGTPVYQIGTPLFDQAVIHAGSRAFTIRARGAAEGHPYIQSATLNGKPLTRTWLSHEEIVKGGELVFAMGPAPNRSWGARPADAPPSITGAR
ncbi:MAG: GH92 family glycosyl hydrolase [Candidatus Sulfopaludibacter sp.]|nr:GH92 family glycosyl hydrolase [Candidatus Sulfopaludibacter sp.]